MAQKLPSPNKKLATRIKNEKLIWLEKHEIDHTIAHESSIPVCLAH